MPTRIHSYGAALITMALFPLLAGTAQARLTPAQRTARTAIIHVWGKNHHPARARLGLRIATCESTLRTWAANGRHLGLFQMGAPERRTYGHGPGAWTQARAALRYYEAARPHWIPWLASRHCWAT